MALAHARPEDRDATLLRAATALFCQEPIHDRDAVRRYEQLAIHLLPNLGESDRAYVASLLGGRRDAPPSVMRILARDAIGIAGSVLRHSPVLSTIDLLGVIAVTGSDHHRLIASRPDLNADVLRALAIARAKYDEASEDAPPAAESTDAADDRAVEAIAEDAVRNALESPSFEGFLEAAPERRMKMLGDAAERQAKARPSIPPRRLDRFLEERFAAAELVGAARRGDRPALLRAFSKALRIETDVVARLLDDPSGEPLALMAKAADLSDADGRAVLLLANKTIGESVDAFFRIADLYASLEATTARAFIDNWREAPARRPEHQPVFADNGDRAKAAQPAHAPAASPARSEQDRAAG